MIEREIEFLSAETLALQTMFVHIFGRRAALDDKLASAIRQGFDDAASDAENTTIKFGKAASPNHLVKTLGIIETLRAATLGDQDKPKHLV